VVAQELVSKLCADGDIEVDPALESEATRELAGVVVDFFTVDAPLGSAPVPLSPLASRIIDRMVNISDNFAEVYSDDSTLEKKISEVLERHLHASEQRS